MPTGGTLVAKRRSRSTQFTGASHVPYAHEGRFGWRDLLAAIVVVPHGRGLARGRRGKAFWFLGCFPTPPSPFSKISFQPLTWYGRPSILVQLAIGSPSEYPSKICPLTALVNLLFHSRWHLHIKRQFVLVPEQANFQGFNLV